MSNKELDRILKDKLEGLEAPYRQEHWLEFEQMLYAEGLSTDDGAELDEIVAEKLAATGPAYNPNHWELMNRRLDEAFSIRHKLLRYKVVEGALLILLVITLFRMDALNVRPLSPQKNSPSQEITLPQITAQLSPQQRILPFDKTEITEAAPIERSEIPPSGAPAKTGMQEDSRAMSAFNRLDNRTSQELVPPVSADARPDFAIPREGPAYAAGPVGLLKSNLALLEKEHPDVGFQPLPAPPEGTRLRVGMFSAADFNYIMTPYDQDFQDEGYSQGAFGYGGGVTLSFEFGKWEIETGAVYSAKKYQPKPRIEVFDGGVAVGGYFRDQLNNIELNIVNVPLNVKYTFLDQKRLSLYALTGASLNMTMQAYYDRQRSFITRGPIFGAPPGGSEVTNYPSPSATSKLSQKSGPGGLLSGGNFADNRYFSINAGLGLEYAIANRTGLFLQPTYFHQILSEGLGPNMDRIHTVSFLFGARVEIK